jgi:hypothetical protein
MNARCLDSGGGASEEKSSMDPSMKKLVIIALGTVGLSILLSAIPASATSLGMTSNCTVVNPNRFQCNFTGLATNILDIQYVSM